MRTSQIKYFDPTKEIFFKDFSKCGDTMVGIPHFYPLKFHCMEKFALRITKQK